MPKSNYDKLGIWNPYFVSRKDTRMIQSQLFDFS
jgi:hypothetical protein